MAAFVIWEQTAATDRDKLEAYRKGVHATIAQFGGKVLGGGVPTAVEGTVTGKRMVVIQFDDLDKANAWYGSDEYGRIKHLRHEGAQGNLIFVG
jgi:uncharacterized protein (DUF1330 family)